MYFGYGANRSAEMMKSVVGRKPEGFPAKLEGYELCVQLWEEIPENVGRILSNHWDSKFRTYCIRPASGSVVSGQVWYLTRVERGLVGEWEIHELWYQPINAQVKDYNGQTFEVETEIIDDPNIKQVVDGENYPTFLNREERMFEVANETREEYLKERAS